MKSILKIMMLFALLVGFTSCSNDDEPGYTDPSLEASNITVAGTWELTEWLGEPLTDGLYCYITLDRKEKTYVMYENMGSMTARKKTGNYTISKDENDETIDLITGDYDYGNGEWNNVYKLKVYKDKMIWTVYEDDSDVSVYTRVNKVPEDIIAQTKLAE